MTYPALVGTPSSRTSRLTPRQCVSSLDHFVTQWISVVICSAGKAVNCCQSQRRVSPDSVTMLNSHVAVFTGGVGPAESTGKPFSRYWPGGSLSPPERLRPEKPREIMLTC